MEKLKKFCSLLLCSVMLLMFIPATSAYASNSGMLGGNISWKLDDYGTLTISGHGEMEDVENTEDIPWYSLRKKIKTVYIEDGVTSVCKGAFYNCENLTVVNLPESITKIGSVAFGECTNLLTINMPDSITTISPYAFYQCSSLLSIDLPDGLDMGWLSYYTFYGCSSIKYVKIPSSGKLISITDYTFANCSNLTAIELPTEIVIWGGTFENCDNLKDIYYLGSEEDWNNHVITIEALDLTNVTIHYNTSMPDSYAVADGYCGIGIAWSLDNHGILKISGTGAMLDYENEENVPWYPLKERVKSVVIENGIQKIGAYAFFLCMNMTEIEIPDSVTEIGDYSFTGCFSLASINLPTGLINLGHGAFMDCIVLTNINLPDNISSIGVSTFYECEKLSSITIPLSLKTIYPSAFEGCNSLESIYYAGTQEDWLLINIANKNDPLYNALIYCDKTSSDTFSISVTLNGSKVTFDQEPVIIDGRTMVPLRAIFEALGASVDWDNSTQTVTAEKSGTIVKMTIGQPTIYVNDSAVTLDVAPQLVNSRTLVPARAVAESFNCNVDWNNDTRTVIITY